MSDGSQQPNEQPRSGDDCPDPNCPGHLVIHTGHKSGVLHVQYVRCWRCKAAPPENKIVIEASQVRKRRPRQKHS